MNGISVIGNERYSIFYITDLSDEIKNIIRSRLSSVCHGAADAATGHPLYSYSNTLKEFIKRYQEKSENLKKGMIGELLFHIILVELLNQYKVNSPFFNMDERSIKKGFDVVLSEPGTHDLWLAEVKSGELHSGKSASQTSIELINAAQNDLCNRLNEESVSLWLNAVNGAKAAIEENRDDRDAIIALLRNCGDAAAQSKLCSKDINVILAGTVFHSLQDQISETAISSKHTRVVDKKCFRRVYLVAIQKETYDKVFQFLKGESDL